MNEPLLTLDRLTIGYDGEPLIRDICLSLRRGEILVLIGANGAGKSTLLKTMSRRLEPVAGTVLLSGEDLSRRKSRELARQIASVRPGILSPEHMTAEEVVAQGRYPYTGALGLLSETDREAIREAMRQLEVEPFCTREFRCLSDGQRQRVLLARALAQEPELLILDEPTAYLDLRYQLELLEILRTLAREKHLSILLSLHELELARRIADRVLCLHGASAELGTPEEILSPERIEALFDLRPGTYRSYLGEEGGPSDEASKQYILADGKRLRCGFTTGTCAALASQAAVCRLLTGVWPESVRLRTPKGWTVKARPEECSVCGESAICAIRKDAGDDADRTDGLRIYAEVRLSDLPGIRITGGEGVGIVTKPGLDQPVGERAINSVPRRMITEAVEAALSAAEDSRGAEVVISAPGGEEIAKNTFNPMLGIEGGISILGTSGVVEPMSMQALVDTIAVELRQARAEGSRTVLLTPGNYGLEFLRSHDLRPSEMPVVRCSNFIGEALDRCGEEGFSDVLLVGHIGKLVKLAGGIMNTHSRTADCRAELFCAHAALCGGGPELCRELMAAATSDACLALLEEAGLLEPVLQSLAAAIGGQLAHRAAGKFRTGAILFSNVYGELVRTADADAILSGNDP